jgi:hypothetical protein
MRRVGSRRADISYESGYSSHRSISPDRTHTLRPVSLFKISGTTRPPSVRSHPHRHAGSHLAFPVTTDAAFSSPPSGSLPVAVVVSCCGGGGCCR